MQPIFQIFPIIPVTSIQVFLSFPGASQKSQIAFIVKFLWSPLIWHSVLPYVSFLTFFFFNNSGHVFCRISFNLDLSDCFLMISFSLNILAKNMCAFQCVPSRVPDVSMSQFFEVRFDHLIILFIQLCLLDPSCSFPRVDHSYSFFYV